MGSHPLPRPFLARETLPSLLSLRRRGLEFALAAALARSPFRWRSSLVSMCFPPTGLHGAAGEGRLNGDDADKERKEEKNGLVALLGGEEGEEEGNALKLEELWEVEGRESSRFPSGDP